jgi:4-aminobutyrate aminotransferase/(S)-3-amino-2-methylpropionate transaminase
MRQHLDSLDRESTLVDDVRGLGPMLLIELVSNPLSKNPAAPQTLEIINESLRRGVVAIRAGLYSNCIRFLPPLNITDDQIDEGMAVIANAVRVIEDKLQPVV